jgi:hypothetical protein
MSRERGVKGERWIVIHDGMPDHPKVEDLSDKAFRALVRLWCYCGQHLTDGVVKAAALKRRASPAVQRELVAAELIEERPDGSVEMHDYLDWQRSSAEVLAVIETKKRAGQRGNHQRWHVERNLVDPDCAWCADQPKHPDEPPPDGSHNGSHVRSQTDRTPISQNVARDRDRDRDRDTSGDLASTAADSNVVELHGPLRSPAAADIAPLRSATPLPSTTAANFASGPEPTRSVNATT